MAWPGVSNAQLFGGGGDIPVIDESNLEQNTSTAGNTGGILNDTEEIRLDEDQNLWTATGQPQYDLFTLETLLAQWHSTIGPRGASDRGLDFYYQDLAHAMLGLYPGFGPANPYFDAVAYSHDTNLNTNQSLLTMLHELAGQDADGRYHNARDAFYYENEAAGGALQALQTGNAINLSTADAVHRLEKITAIAANVALANNTHHLQHEAWGVAALQAMFAQDNANTRSVRDLLDDPRGGLTEMAPIGGEQQ